MVLRANIIVSNKLMIEAYISILLVVVIIHVLSVATKQEESVPDAGELTTTILVAIDARRWDADDLMRTVKGLLADAATPSTVCFTIGVRETSHYRRALPNNMQPRVRMRAPQQHMTARALALVCARLSCHTKFAFWHANRDPE